MREWFAILGVDEAADERSIKRAYAKLLKSIDQEQDPAGFIALREAYEEGRYVARYRAQAEQVPEETKPEEPTPEEPKPVKSKTEEPKTEEPKTEVSQAEVSQAEAVEVDISGHTETMPEFEPDNAPEPTPVQPEPASANPAHALMEEALSLAASPWGAGNAEAWQNLLDDDRLIDLDVYADFENYLLNWLLDVHGYFDEENRVAKAVIPADVARLLFARFGWDEKRNSIYANAEPFDFLAERLISTPKNPKQKPVPPRKPRKPSPRLDKFTAWFDGPGGKIMIGLFIIAMVLLRILMAGTSLTNKLFME